VRLEFGGTQLTSVGGRLVMRELDDVLGLSDLASGALNDRGKAPSGPQRCGFRGEWALISRDRGHAFRAMLGSHFTGSRAGWPTLSWSQA